MNDDTLTRTYRSRVVELEPGLWLAANCQITRNFNRARVFKSAHAANCGLEYFLRNNATGLTWQFPMIHKV